MVLASILNDQTVEVHLDVLEYKLLTEVMRVASQDNGLLTKVAAVVKSHGIAMHKDEAAAMLTSMRMVSETLADRILGVRKVRERAAMATDAASVGN